MRSISVVSVPVSDQSRALAFYRDVLGFDVVADAEYGDGLRWVQVAPPQGSVSLALVTWFDEMPPGSLRGLVVDTDDIRRDHQELLGRGADVKGPPSAEPGGTFCFVRDPDGNVISLHQEGSA